ncbi:iron chelate uptake ABC transporter family permease subunit [Microbacterium sp. G2-8]|uniref:iron chelate uptake ABC transporter family permease subunit n=1 Tax=Microbacterium sp. G2-8 TaxID=2842454 RepID=UPI001C8A207E|nr:iron chelate uptake ABC transporter family permease subunit [Microbacterium sp. G2-8]
MTGAGSSTRRTVTGAAARRARAWTTVFAGALVAALVASVFVGANPLRADEILAALAGAGTDEARFVVWDQRVPRAIAGVMVGVALGVAGALIQAFTRNPLADPGILGVNAGAAFFVAIGIAFLGITEPGGYVWLACLGAFVVTAAVYALGSSRSGPADPIRLTVAGVAVGAVLAGLTTGLTLTHPDAFDRMRGWNAGSLLERGPDVLATTAPLLVAGLALAFVAAPALNSVALGADVARSHGVRLARVQGSAIAAVTLLAGTATAIAGPIAFVGLMIPHVVRWSVGTDQRRIFAVSMLAAPALVVLADIVGRVAAPGEMPAGIVTAFVGAPVLIALVRRRRASAL